MKSKKEEKKLNIKIGICCQDTVYAKTMASIAFNIIQSKGLVTDILMRQGSDITSARTWVIQKAIEDGATHVLFVDHDMVFPPTALTTHLEAKKDIIGTEYFKRKFPKEATFVPLDKHSTHELYKAKFCGTGLMLIDLNIFKTMAKPWFNIGRDSQGQVAIGEDAWMCLSAQDIGHEVWIDPQIQVGHIGSYTY